MQTKQFHLGDVLSITTGRLVSPRHIDGVYDILNFMTGDNLFTHQLPRASDECKPYLVAQFPQLAAAEMESALAELGDALKTKTGKAKAKKIVRGLAREAGRQVRRDVRGEVHPGRRARGEEPDRGSRGDDGRTGEGHRRQNLVSES